MSQDPLDKSPDGILDNSQDDSVQPRSWRTIFLVASFVLAGFAVGSGFIFVGSLEVANRFDVYGREAVRPGHQHVFRVWGFTDDPPGPLADARLTIELDGLDSKSTAVLNDTGAAIAKLDIPEDLAADTVTAVATMEVDGEILEAGRFDLSVVRPDRATKDISVSSLPDAGDDPWIVQLFTPRGVVLPHVENRIFVRVMDATTYQPVSDAEIQFELTYGNLAGEPPEPVTTNRFGLAVLPLTPLDETDWTLTASRPESSVVQRRTLYAAPLSLRVQPLERNLTPGSELRFRVFSVSSVDHVFADIIADGAWLASTRRPRGTDGSVVSWTPEIASPVEPEVVDLTLCFSAIQCEETAAIAPIVWSMTRLSEKEQARSMGREAIARGMHPGWIEVVLGNMDNANRQDLLMLVDFLAVAMEVEFQAAEPLLQTEPITQARLEEMRTTLRTWLNLLAVLLVVAGGLLIALFVIRSTTPRKRALEAFATDAPDDGGLLDDATPSEGRRILAFYLEIAAVSLTIAVFAGGIILLLGQL